MRYVAILLLSALLLGTVFVIVGSSRPNPAFGTVNPQPVPLASPGETHTPNLNALSPSPGGGVLTLPLDGLQTDYSLLAVAAQGTSTRAEPFPPTVSILDVGDPVPRIQCQAGYTATVYAQGLFSPDGLAFDPSGVLHVAEETAGRVSRIGPGGSVTTVVSGLTSPEGIAFDTAGNLYVVEDVQAGRLVQVAPGGGSTDLATGRDAPEGVVWTSDGTTYITESNVQFSSEPSEFRTHVTAVSSLGEVTTILTDTLYWSYAGITMGADGLLYVTNEASGAETTDSVFTVEPATGERTLFVSGLVAPEGLRFAADGDFPLYVAEENIGDGNGRLSRVEADGSHAPFCTGFFNIEDVVLDGSGWLYVSEDSSGWIIAIRPSAWISVSAVTDVASAYPGETAIYTLSLTASEGFAAPVTLTLDGAPSEALVSFDPNPVTPPGTSQLSITTTASTLVGTYAMTATGSASQVTDTVPLTLTVNPTITLVAQPEVHTVLPGDTAAYTLSLIASEGFSDPVTLTLQGAPPESFSSFVPNPVIPPGASQLVITTTASTMAGTYAMTVTGASGVLTNTANLTLIVTSKNYLPIIFGGL